MTIRIQTICKSKLLRRWILLLFLMLFFISCGSEIESTEINPKIRFVTLSPHLAELVVSAGALDNLVGVVSYSDFPEEVKSIKHVGDAFKLDYEAIVILKPDYVLSWKGGTPASVVTKLKSLNINVIETEVNELSDISSTIKQIAELAHTTEAANLNISLFSNTLNSIKTKSHQVKSAFIQTYHQPLYTISGEHWMSKAVEFCGYKNIFDDLSQLSATVNVEAVINLNPQVIINIAKQTDPQWQKWKNLNAVKNNQIITIDPDIISRPSMRILDGIKQLCGY